MPYYDRDGKVGIGKKDDIEKVVFDPLWPSETKGNGNIVKNNKNTGAGQGIASFVLKAKCKQCGFPLDLNRNDTTGGSLDGNGAGGAISTSTYTATLSNGDTHTEQAGSQAYNQGAGCPLCFSKNSSHNKLDQSQNVKPFDSIPRAGF